MNETIRTLMERRSIRAYRKEQVREEELQIILEAGKYAPTAMGRQSVTMVVVQDPETIAYLEQENATIKGVPGGHVFFGAPTVVVVLADPEATPTPENPQRDGALVMGNLMNAAWSVGVASCWINRAKEFYALPQGKALLRKWGLPERLEGVGNCILGYMDGEAPVPKPRKENYVLWT